MPKNTYKLLSWNVNGLRAVARKNLFFPLFEAHKPDILCLQETKANPDQLDAPVKEVAGFMPHFAWAERPGYSGVATYSRPQAASVKAGLGMDHYDCEGRVLVSDYGDFVLFNVYFPNGKASPERLQYKMNFYKDFLATLQEYRKKGKKNLVICGDVNTAHKEIDLARPKENRKISGFLPEECAWMDEWVGAGFVDTFRVFEPGGGHYTWWDVISRARERNVGWRIDYFFISEELKGALRSAFILPQVMGSDHCPVGIELSL